ncbi:MAG TPA: RNA polymerase subunit sigma-70 [Actinophytocola sp.]|nr:RNA polymerase subunit sigma-70 [Actinophytocola sp.]HYQ63115.1 RNA polymerase subunit sigma-70 [Actinophytocola sp.]
MRPVDGQVSARARGGDEHAFAQLVAPYRRELHLHCYRMLGSLTDAEDVLQETLLAAWRGLAGFEGRSSVRAWLYRIATNRCLNAIRAGNRRPVTDPVPPFPLPEPSRRAEITWLRPYPDSLLAGIADTSPGPAARYEATEAIGLAFVAALQRMPPRQAAALVLRDVLGFATDEVAGMLDTTGTAVKGALQRARTALAAQTRPRPDRDTERELGRRFAAAFVAADIDGLVELLTDDAWLSMPPAPHEYHGVAAVRTFLETAFENRGDHVMHLVPTSVNGQVAYASYLGDPDAETAGPAGLFVLAMAGDRVHAVTRFHLDPTDPRFDLPARLTTRGRKPTRAPRGRSFRSGSTEM